MKEIKIRKEKETEKVRDKEKETRGQKEVRDKEKTRREAQRETDFFRVRELERFHPTFLLLLLPVRFLFSFPHFRLSSSSLRDPPPFVSIERKEIVTSSADLGKRKKPKEELSLYLTRFSLLFSFPQPPPYSSTSYSPRRRSRREAQPRPSSSPRRA